ncbi:MAG: class I SAM-dependent methyltransferase [Deltaproteobacteria bacterium]|uniref:Class I SAM-dependent methyltransferase n=1 Tax=Candidatus Zymogenus saltonus TaxID=2844893 RepID=A0A9D8KCR3_9DELT|nr:class I SAM-dependent methyltransferase [Candidatus Zymogenus saltonus]
MAMISINDTTEYHLSDAASLGWEQTISECLKDTDSPYMLALKTKRMYGDTISDLFKANNLIRSGDRILEVGGGYGRLAERLLTNFPDISITMADVSPVFLNRQRELLQRFGGRVDFVNSDAFEFLGSAGDFDLIIANEILGDLPAVVDIRKSDLIELAKPGRAPDGVDESGAECLSRALDYINDLGIDIDSAPDTINLNTGALRFISAAMERAPALWVSEHSSDFEIPKSMSEMFRDDRADRWPKKIILFNHNEVSVSFDHMKRGVDGLGYKHDGGSLMELLGVRDDNEIRYILLSGSIVSETHEIIGEFLNHVKEYQWLLVKR